MKKTFKNCLIHSKDPSFIPVTLKSYYFLKIINTENILYMLKILGPNDATGTFDSGEQWVYEYEASGYFGEYRDHVDIAAYEYAIEIGFTEISEEEFMRLVEEKYPNWRSLPGENPKKIIFSSSCNTFEVK